MLGSFGILTLQYHQMSTQQRPMTNDSDDATGDDIEIDRGDGSQRSRTTATAGLSPDEKRVQNALIKKAYQDFSDDPFTFMITRGAPHLVQEIVEAVDRVDQETVEKVWRFSKDDGFFKRQPGGNSLRFTPKAVWRAKELGEEVRLDETVQDEILDVLLQAYRENPRGPKIDRDELIEAVGRDTDDIDHNLWLLEEKGYVETEAFLNARDGGYDNVKITKLGREVTQ